MSNVIPTMHDLSPRERAVAAVLGRYGLAHGQYTEDASAMEWLPMEAVDVSYALDEGMSPSSVLYSTGFWTEDDGPFPESLTADLIAAHNGGTGGDDPIRLHDCGRFHRPSEECPTNGSGSQR